MLQIQFIRENADLIIDKLKVRNIDAKATISSVLEVDKKLREAKTDFESQKAQANSLAKSIGDLFKQGKIREARSLLAAQARPEEMDEIFRWMYDNLELFSSTQEGQDSAIMIIRTGLVNHSFVADPEINLSATMVELSQING